MKSPFGIAFVTIALVVGTSCSQAPVSLVPKGCSGVSCGIACPGAILAPPRLYYPADGATSVPTTIGEIIVGYGPTDGTFSLAASGASPLPLGSAEPVPMPAPTTLPTTDPASFAAVPLPTLSPKTTYSVVYAAPKTTNPCGSGEASGTIGTFST